MTGGLRDFVFWSCPKCHARLSSDHKDTLAFMVERHKKKCK